MMNGEAMSADKKIPTNFRRNAKGEAHINHMADIDKQRFDSGFEERQKAMDTIIATLNEDPACSACQCSAALYVASQIAAQELNLNASDFGKMAEAFHNDLLRQIGKGEKDKDERSEGN